LAAIVVSVALSLPLAAPAKAAAKTLHCAVGRFVVDGEELFAGARTAGGAQRAPHLTAGAALHGETITMLEGRVSIDGVCASRRAQIRRGKQRTKVRVTWPGCDGVPGRVRLRVAIDADGCRRATGTMTARKAGIAREFAAYRVLGDPEDCTGEDTFAVLQQKVFGAKGCRVQTCHGSGAAGRLDLQYGVAYSSLVDVTASNAAAAAVEKRRVVPGDAEASFLWQKVAGSLGRGEGGRMPQVGAALDPLELDLVRAWIDAGAPSTGVVADAPCLPAHRFEPAPPLAPPPGGHQVVLEGPTLAPGEEIEGCMWVQVPNEADFVVGSWEYSLNPGTHHFAVWEHERGGTPRLNAFQAGDVACLSQGARFAISISGAPEAPYFVDAYPPATGKVLPGGSYLGLNPHYYNEFDVPVQVKVWINLHPVAGPVEHVADTLLSLLGTFGDANSYSIYVPPFSTGALRLRYYNEFDRPMSIFQLSSHQHKRGVRFTAWRSDGTTIFENFDWSHPALLNLAPPFVLAPGDYIEYECVHDNGVARPVRRCGDAPADSGCTPGEPVPLTFGVSAEDDMCFLTGLYWLD
jgi:hypothetical protein